MCSFDAKIGVMNIGRMKYIRRGQTKTLHCPTFHLTSRLSLNCQRRKHLLSSQLSQSYDNTDSLHNLILSMFFLSLTLQENKRSLYKGLTVILKYIYKFFSKVEFNSLPVKCGLNLVT